MIILAKDTIETKLIKQKAQCEHCNRGIGVVFLTERRRLCEKCHFEVADILFNSYAN